MRLQKILSAFFTDVKLIIYLMNIEFNMFAINKPKIINPKMCTYVKSCYCNININYFAISIIVYYIRINCNHYYYNSRLFSIRTKDLVCTFVINNYKCF